MRRRRRTLLAIAAATAGALVVAAVTLGFIMGSTMRTEKGSARATSPREFVVTYRLADGEVIHEDVPLGEVRCTLARDVAMISAPSGDTTRAFQAAGDSHRLTSLWLRFGDQVFVATEEAALLGERLTVTRLAGQINDWSSGDLPGAVVTADASVSGSLSCDVIRR